MLGEVRLVMGSFSGKIAQRFENMVNNDVIFDHDGGMVLPVGLATTSFRVGQHKAGFDPG
jgi:hypothetical protein